MRRRLLAARSSCLDHSDGPAAASQRRGGTANLRSIPRRSFSATMSLSHVQGGERWVAIDGPLQSGLELDECQKESQPSK